MQTTFLLSILICKMQVMVVSARLLSELDDSI